MAAPMAPPPPRPELAAVGLDDSLPPGVVPPDRRFLCSCKWPSDLEHSEVVLFVRLSGVAASKNVTYGVTFGTSTPAGT